MTSNKRVLILGAGSAGLNAALGLRKAYSIAPDLEITLVDQHNYHLFPPLLFQVATGGLEPGHICFPIRSLLRKERIRFRESRVENIDLDGKRVITSEGILDWDFLVIALGSTTNFFGLTDVEKNALPLKNLKDAIAIYNHILGNYEKATLETENERRRELLTFVVVGGGATGVELTSSIQDFVRKVLVRDYPSIGRDEVRVILAESRNEILSDMNPNLARVALKRLRSQGAEAMLDTSITGAWHEGVKTKADEVIPSHTVVWVAGVKPVNVVGKLGLDSGADGRIVVKENLEVPGLPGVYIIGDCAYLRPEQQDQSLPPTGQVAVQQGKACARNIMKALSGQPQEPLRYHYRGDLISMGRNVAVAQFGRFAFDGFAAWLLWRTYYLNRLMGFKNKLSVALDWSFAYFYRRNTARLE